MVGAGHAWLAAMIVLCTGLSARADGCDALAARLIRVTGASFAGREESLIVFRAADAERVSLDCRAPHQMLLRSVYREPNRYYFVLIGLAASSLARVRAEDAETLALRLHQASLLTGEAQQGVVGDVAMRCEPGDRPDGLTRGTLCRIEVVRPAVLRRRAALPGDGAPG